MDIESRDPSESQEAAPVRKEGEEREELRRIPAARNWPVFFLLLSLTLFTTFLAGGLMYAVSLFFILGAHEFGHYWASRKNQVGATLPYFIPAPPNWFIFGTFGAMIIIRDPIPNRRVLMEIGASGPIAGFLVAVPMLIAGLFLSTTAPATGEHGLVFGNSIILTVFSKIILGVTPFTPDVNIQLHPMAFAGWVGLFVTALNLFPVGQLDGGHIIFSLCGENYKIWSRIFLGFLFILVYFWPGWLFWAILLLILTRLKPAQLIDETVLPEKRHRILGILAIFIFVVTFVPVPLEVV
ncbi:MAG: site-2 protease family protein [Nitrospinaceae bacterium]